VSILAARKLENLLKKKKVQKERKGKGPKRKILVSK
jgi:hypothetical protein